MSKLVKTTQQKNECTVGYDYFNNYYNSLGLEFPNTIMIFSELISANILTRVVVIAVWSLLKHREIG